MYCEDKLSTNIKLSQLIGWAQWVLIHLPEGTKLPQDLPIQESFTSQLVRVRFPNLSNYTNNDGKLSQIQRVSLHYPGIYSVMPIQCKHNIYSQTTAWSYHPCIHSVPLQVVQDSYICMHVCNPVLFRFTATACWLYKSELLDVGRLKLLPILGMKNSLQHTLANAWLLYVQKTTRSYSYPMY